MSEQISIFTCTVRAWVSKKERRLRRGADAVTHTCGKKFYASILEILIHIRTVCVLFVSYIQYLESSTGMQVRQERKQGNNKHRGGEEKVYGRTACEGGSLHGTPVLPHKFMLNGKIHNFQLVKLSCGTHYAVVLDVWQGIHGEVPRPDEIALITVELTRSTRKALRSARTCKAMEVFHIDINFD